MAWTKKSLKNTYLNFKRPFITFISYVSFLYGIKKMFHPTVTCVECHHWFICNWTASAVSVFHMRHLFTKQPILFHSFQNTSQISTLYNNGCFYNIKLETGYLLFSKYGNIFTMLKYILWNTHILWFTTDILTLLQTP